MQNLWRIGTGLAFVLAIISVNLWRELRAERALTTELRAQVAGSTNGDFAYVPTQRTEVRPDATTAAAKNAGRNAEVVPPIPVQNVATNLNTQNVFNGEGDLMRDPEYRKARLIQARMTLKRNYTDVAEELGLSEKEAEQLFDILAERQVGGNFPVPLGPNGQSDRQAMEDAIRMRRDAQRQQEEALQALLGPSRQAKWQEYQLSLSARSRATSMSSMLAASGHPLTESQLRPLTTALIAEEKYMRETQSPNRQSAPTNIESFARQQEEAVNRQEESNRRYLDIAAAHMTSKQLALVKEVLEQQITISRAAARMQRERAQAARPGAAVEPAVIAN
jgi:hypothetical protein